MYADGQLEAVSVAVLAGDSALTHRAAKDGVIALELRGAAVEVVRLAVRHLVRLPLEHCAAKPSRRTGVVEAPPVRLAGCRRGLVHGALHPMPVRPARDCAL